MKGKCIIHILGMWLLCFMFSVASADDVWQHADGQKERLIGWSSDQSHSWDTPYSFPDERTEALMRKIIGGSKKKTILYQDVEKIRSFRLSDASTEVALEYISVLKYFPNLDVVDIHNCGLKEVPIEIGELPITSLSLQGNDLRDISALSNMKNLSDLQLQANNFITDYSPLAEIDNLKSLNISMFSARDTSVIARCNKLRSLSLCGYFQRVVNNETYQIEHYCVPINDVSFLEELPELMRVGFYGFSDISDTAMEQIENITTDIKIDVRIRDGEVRDLHNDLKNGITGHWIGENALHGLNKEDILTFYEHKE
ncbi:MAG: leucine-rich repeat domain-containing protein [Clostridia bacterium]|nr:leucine-rich repeat domain-containing protein [Clostridia bacterium]